VTISLDLERDAASLIGQPWTAADTPALLVDLDRLESNIAASPHIGGMALQWFRGPKRPPASSRAEGRWPTMPVSCDSAAAASTHVPAQGDIVLRAHGQAKVGRWIARSGRWPPQL
jgi:hypothetical protein